MLKDSNFEFESAVKLIVANERARRLDERSVEKDLNRCFPGDSESDVYDERLAAKIMEEIEGLRVIDLHSTVSKPTPFAFYIGDKHELLRNSGVECAVDLSYLPETMMNYMEGISIECGARGTRQAAKTAFKATKNFLAAEGVLEADFSRSRPELFEIFDESMGSKYTFEAENFRKVEEGEVYAVNGSDKKKAEQDFYPVLMSDNGYSHKIGYKGRKIK